MRIGAFVRSIKSPYNEISTYTDITYAFLSFTFAREIDRSEQCQGEVMIIISDSHIFNVMIVIY